MVNKKPNILFLTIDSLRADKFHGKNKSSKTPNIAFLINNGAYFNQAISTIDGTFSSLGSIFTSKLPFKTNITWSKNHSKALGFFKSIKDYGYSQYSVTPDHAFFKSISENFDDKILTSTSSYLGLWEGIGDLIISKLDYCKKIQSPWIFYSHIMDLHTLKPIPDEYNVPEFGETEYDRRISLIDIWLGKFLEKIELSKTLIILTSDHGEFIHDLDKHPEYVPTLQKFFRIGKKVTPQFLTPIGINFFEYLRSTVKKQRIKKLKKTLSDKELRTFNERGYGILFDEVLRVPLLFSGFGIKKNSIIDKQVSHVDILPTIESIIGSFHNDDKIDVRSLIEIINGNSIQDTPAYIESVPKLADLEGDTIGIRTSKYKYCRSRKNPKENIFLFDLESDPLETKNLANESLQVITQMEQILLKITNFSIDDGDEELSEEEYAKTKNELKKLGYV